MNRIYTAEELRAMSRLTPVELRTPVRPARETVESGAIGGRGSLVALLRRFRGRSAVGRSAPGTV